MSTISTTIISWLTNGFLAMGILFWLFGTFPLLQSRRSVITKLHLLTVSDTLGSMAIVVGLFLKLPREWPLLLLAIICLCLWNTILGYVLAYCATGEKHTNV
jgi:multicomponent Na+:H+ antiporter subunit G